MSFVNGQARGSAPWTVARREGFGPTLQTLLIRTWMRVAPSFGRSVTIPGTVSPSSALRMTRIEWLHGIGLFYLGRGYPGVCQCNPSILPDSNHSVLLENRGERTDLFERAFADPLAQQQC